MIKNKVVYKTLHYHFSFEQIQLSFPNLGYHDIYYLIKNDNYYNFYLRKISGKFEASYTYLEDTYNIDDVFSNNNTMNSLNDNIICNHNDNKKYLLIHFKSINNNPALFDLVSMESNVEIGIIEGNYLVANLKEGGTPPIRNHMPSGNNITIYIEYLGCKLENDEKIYVDFGDNNIISFNETINQGIFNISLKLEKNPVYSDKYCALLIKFGYKDIYINTIEEKFNISMPDKLVYQYPKIEKDNHYHFYFYNNETNNIYWINCNIFYENKYFIYTYLYDNQRENNDILMNPYNILENDNKLTYMYSCEKIHATNIKFDIVELKQEVGILNKFFLTNNYTEYIFPLINITTKIIIQDISQFEFIKEEYPKLYIGNYKTSINDRSIIIAASNGTIPKIVIYGVNTALKVNYIEKDADFFSEISESSKKFTISSNESGIYKLNIRPLLYNEDIKYIIHAIKNYPDLYGTNKKYYSEKIIENFGDISLNSTFIKKSSDVFEYTFNISDKITSEYDKFMFVAEDIKTGYILISDVELCSYIKNENNYTTLIIILVSVFVVLIIAIVVIFILLRRRRNKIKSNSEEKEMLTQ